MRRANRNGRAEYWPIHNGNFPDTFMYYSDTHGLEIVNPTYVDLYKYYHNVIVSFINIPTEMLFSDIL